MTASNRKHDSQQEGIVNEFVNRYLFKKIFKSSELITNRTLQLAGVDIQADGKNYDLKAQSSSRYLNNPTNTFILEISFIDRDGDRVDGWFIQDTMTDYYAFIWMPKVNVTNGSINEVDDIGEVEVLIVDKAMLRDGIKSLMGDTSFMDIENELLDREAYDNEMKPAVYKHGIKFVLSNQLAEAPLCAVVTKDLLKRFATSHYLVTKEKVSEI